MSDPVYRVVRFSADHDTDKFDCGVPAYNTWLTRHAVGSVLAGVCAVYLLTETTSDRTRVVGYYSINPTQVLREDAPPSLSRGWPHTVLAWRIGKLAIHTDLRAEDGVQWGRQLLREALAAIIGIAGGGKVIVIDADNEGLLDFYTRNGFKPTGIPGDLALYLKISTARKALNRATR